MNMFFECSEISAEIWPEYNIDRKYEYMQTEYMQNTCRIYADRNMQNIRRQNI